jgi:hypothetical protein
MGKNLWIMYLVFNLQQNKIIQNIRIQWKRILYIL